MIRILMMGTGPFAVPTFEKFCEHGEPYQMVGLVTRPLAAITKTHGKSHQVIPPMRQTAIAQGIEIFDPANVNTLESIEHLRTFEADLFIVCDYGQILCAELLTLPRYGCINLHGSLLPKYRGASPISWAIYHGETVAGVSVIQMTPKVDAGGVIAQASLPIGEKETTAELEPRLAELGAPLVLRTVGELIAGKIRIIPQDPALVTKAPRLKRESGEIDWTRTATEIRNHWRSMEPWPRSSTWWWRAAGRDPVRLILGSLEVVDYPIPVGQANDVTITSAISGVGTTGMGAGAIGIPAPGTILEATKDRLIVAAGVGRCMGVKWEDTSMNAVNAVQTVPAIRIYEVQPAGKKALTAAAFINGYRPQPGQQFGKMDSPLTRER